MVQTQEIQTGLTRQRHDVDILVVLIAVSVMPLFLYGMPAFWLLLTTVLTAVAAEYICQRVAGKRRIEKGDLSYLITAFVTALLLPASAPVWVGAAAVTFALCVAKHPFGGRGANIFNPAAAGVAFVTLCWPEFFKKYPIPFSLIDGVYSYMDSPASTLRVGGTPKIGRLDMILGNFAGPMGATCVIVLLCCLLFLAYRRSACIRAIIPAFGVVAVVAVLFPRLATGRINSLIFELCSGALMFGLTFMVSDPGTLPKLKSGRVVYGLLIGVLVVIFRRFGAFDMEMAFVILLANALASACDGYALFVIKRFNRLKARLLEKKAAKAEEKAGDGNA